MKKLILFLLIFSFSAVSFGQAKKFFISLPVYTYQFGNTSTAIHNQLISQGFGDEYIYYFLGQQYVDDHPITSRSMSFVVKTGYRINTYGSIYLLGGIREKGSVEGFKREGFYDEEFFGIRIRHSLGPTMKVNYSVFQVGGGYEYSFPNSTIKIGAAASAFISKYSMEKENSVSESSVLPGLSLNLRIPLGKERKPIGLEVFTDLNIAPSAKIKELNGEGMQFKETTTSMTRVAIGIAMSFRGKN